MASMLMTLGVGYLIRIIILRKLDMEAAVTFRPRGRLEVITSDSFFRRWARIFTRV